jgi:hypothetical protein
MDPVLFLVASMLAAIVLGPIFGAESRPAFLRPDRRPRSFAHSMRPSDWEPSEFER